MIPHPGSVIWLNCGNLPGFGSISQLHISAECVNCFEFKMQNVTTFVSCISPQPPGRSAADASSGRVLEILGRWLSTHEYLNTGQDTIIGHDCPPEADVLGIRGKTVLTAFFDHTDRETFRCYVCYDRSYDLEDAILHQRRAMHHQD